jgi:hypothetical protein
MAMRTGDELRDIVLENLEEELNADSERISPPRSTGAREHSGVRYLNRPL